MRHLVRIGRIISFVVAALIMGCQKEPAETDVTVNDIDGNTYSKVRIGSQTWMGENLKTTRLNDGMEIPNVTDTLAWSEMKGMGYCWYNNDVGNKNIYGALYNWFTVNTGELCPAGWHVPTDVDWSTLEIYLGGRSVAGGKLKETGLTYWLTPNKGATNESGFTALPGGEREYYGAFDYLGYTAIMWSSTYVDELFGSVYAMSFNSSYSGFDFDSKPLGHSVRCLKDN